MKIGVYGGTFNPIHNGHVHILKDFIKIIGLDLVYIIPTARSPHKSLEWIAGAKDRMRMCELAAEDIDTGKVVVSDVEIKRKGKSFTVDTLRQLHKIHPDDDFYLIMGEDMFLTVDKWYDAETIFKLATICAAPRSNSPKLIKFAKKLESLHNAKTIITEIDYMPVSSTQIRVFASKGYSIDGLVPKKVQQYIEENHIYQEYKEND